MAEKVADLFAEIGARVNEAQWKTADAVISKAKVAVGAFLGVVTVGAIGSFIESTVELGGKLADAEQQTGVSAQTLQEYGYIAKLAGADVDEVIGSIGRLNKGLAEAAKTGQGPAADGLRAIGIGLNDPAVKAQNIDEILLEIADKFAAMPDGPKKVAAAMDLFGKSGARLIPTLNAGGDGIIKLKKEAADLGIILSKEDISQLDQLGDDTDRLKMAMGGLKNQLVIALAPAINTVVTSLTDFIKENREVIKGILDATAAIIKSKPFWIALGVIIAAVAVKGALAFAAFLAPLLPLILILTALSLVIYDVWKSVKTGKGVSASVFNFLAEKVAAIRDAFASVGQWIEGVFQSIYDRVVAAWNKIQEVVSAIKALPGRAWNAVTQNDTTTGIDRFSAPAPVRFGGSSIAGRFNPDAFAALMQQPTPVAQLGATSAEGASSTMNVDVGGIVVNPAPGQDEAAIGRAASDSLAAALRHVQSQRTGNGNG